MQHLPLSLAAANILSSPLPHAGADVAPSLQSKPGWKLACMETGPWREELGPMDDPLIKVRV